MLVDDCPDGIVKIMEVCWQSDPQNRPTFATLCGLITSLIPVHQPEQTEIQGEFTNAFYNNTYSQPIQYN